VVGAGQHELLLDGRRAGETTFSVVDASGKRDYLVKIYDEDLDKLKERVDFLLNAAGYGNLITEVGDKERKIFITGIVYNLKNEDLTDVQDRFASQIEPVMDKIVNLVEFEDDAISVEIDVEVLEIYKDDVDKLGLEWNKAVSFAEPTTGDDGDPGDSWPQVLNPSKYFEVMKTWRTSGLAATLNFLKQRNRARTLSRPKIVALSGKEASLNVGGERGIITEANISDSGTTSYDVEYVNYGISLSITPIVKANNEIQVALTTEITDVDTSNSLSLGEGISTPGFSERSASTELTVKDGETVLLAGMIESKLTDNRDGIWGLADIPFLGALFRGKYKKTEVTDILIILTPRIVRNKRREEGSAVANVNIPRNESSSLSFSDLDKGQDVGQRSKKDPIVNYSGLVQDIIHSQVRYPRELKDHSIEGTVELSLHVQASGKLLGVVVMRSSGSPLLDEIAEKAIKKISPFPAFPEEVNIKDLWIDIPIIYKIRDNT